MINQLFRMIRIVGENTIKIQENPPQNRYKTAL